MTELRYSVRLSLLSPERHYKLGDRSLSVSGRDDISFTEIRQIRTFEAFGGSIGEFSRCVVDPARGASVVLSSKHFAGLARFEDRRASYEPFVSTMIDRVARMNSQTRFVSGMPMGLWLFWILSLGAAAVVTPLCVLTAAILALEGQPVDGGFLVVNMLLVGTWIGFFGYWRTIWKNRPVVYDPRTA